MKKGAVPRPQAVGPMIPGWAIMLAIPVTAVVTVWALKGRPGFASEPRDIPMQVQPTAAAQAQMPAPAMPPGAPAQAEPPPPVDGFTKVAVLGPRAPIIIAGSRRPHLDRGNCTLCHQVVRPNGAPMPTIRSDSIMPHPYPGGMCINCHTTVPPLSGFQGVALPGVMQPQNNNNPDAKWMGMEVGPVTAMSAMQNGTPAGINGAVVTEVEGQAQNAGVRMGDVVMGVEGTPVTDVMSFNAATQNGQLPAGKVQVLRGGTLIEVPLGMQPPVMGAMGGMGAMGATAGCAPGAQMPPPMQQPMQPQMPPPMQQPMQQPMQPQMQPPQPQTGAAAF